MSVIIYPRDFNPEEWESFVDGIAVVIDAGSEATIEWSPAYTPCKIWQIGITMNDNTNYIVSVDDKVIWNNPFYPIDPYTVDPLFHTLRDVNNSVKAIIQNTYTVARTFHIIIRGFYKRGGIP